MNNTEISKPVKFLVWIFMAFAASYTFWQLAHTEHYARDSLSDLTTAFEAVRHPDEAQHSDALNAVSKLIFQAVSVNFLRDPHEFDHSISSFPF